MLCLHKQIPSTVLLRNKCVSKKKKNTQFRHSQEMPFNQHKSEQVYLHLTIIHMLLKKIKKERYKEKQ